MDPGFFKGEGGGGDGWYPRVADSMRHARKMLQFDNWPAT